MTKITFNEDGKYLLPIRILGVADAERDALWAAAERLVNEGYAAWISPASCLWPGIYEVRQRHDTG